MLGAFGEYENPLFNGHAFQDFAAKRPDSEKRGFDLVGCFAPLLDVMMTNHRLESDLHRQRMAELWETGQDDKCLRL